MERKIELKRVNATRDIKESFHSLGDEIDILSKKIKDWFSIPKLYPDEFKKILSDQTLKFPETYPVPNHFIYNCNTTETSKTEIFLNVPKKCCNIKKSKLNVKIFKKNQEISEEFVCKRTDYDNSETIEQNSANCSCDKKDEKKFSVKLDENLFLSLISDEIDDDKKFPSIQILVKCDGECVQKLKPTIINRDEIDVFGSFNEQQQIFCVETPPPPKICSVIKSSSSSKSFGKKKSSRERSNPEINKISSLGSFSLFFIVNNMDTGGCPHKVNQGILSTALICLKVNGDDGEICSCKSPSPLRCSCASLPKKIESELPICACGPEEEEDIPCSTKVPIPQICSYKPPPKVKECHPPKCAWRTTSKPEVVSPKYSCKSSSKEKETQCSCRSEPPSPPPPKFSCKSSSKEKQIPAEIPKCSSSKKQELVQPKYSCKSSSKEKEIPPTPSCSCPSSILSKEIKIPAKCLCALAQSTEPSTKVKCSCRSQKVESGCQACCSKFSKQVQYVEPPKQMSTQTVPSQKNVGNQPSNTTQMSNILSKMCPPCCVINLPIKSRNGTSCCNLKAESSTFCTPVTPPQSPIFSKNYKCPDVPCATPPSASTSKLRISSTSKVEQPPTPKASILKTVSSKTTRKSRSNIEIPRSTCSFKGECREKYQMKPLGCSKPKLCKVNKSKDLKGGLEEDFLFGTSKKDDLTLITEDYEDLKQAFEKFLMSTEKRPKCKYVRKG